MTGGEIAKTVRLAIAGIEIGNIKNEEGDEYKLNVSVPQNTDNALDAFNKINVTSLSGSLVPLNSFKTVCIHNPTL